ncbi:MAG: hypothetical protein B6D61_10690 [Bacteroidetes bacterium 4484_249]|nr:MAG: hypothetical protein B6D61_10690 [Bacteroidetes bacterium 4484_249]
MKKIIYTLLISQVLFWGGGLLAQDCANTANIYPFTYGGANYEIVLENQSWVDAAACAVERGGFLSEIDSQEEQDSIFFHLNNAGINLSNTVAPDGGGASYVWIGGNDIATEGEWIWDGDDDGEGPQFWQGNYNGTPVNGLYNNWGNEPDNWNNQDGLGLALTEWPLGSGSLGQPGQWNDVDDSNTLYYVIEYNNSTGTLENNSNYANVSVYPNPVNNQATIYFSHNIKGTASISIFNSFGQLVQKIEDVKISNESNSVLFDAGGLKPGIYLYTIETPDYIVSNKFIKN